MTTAQRVYRSRVCWNGYRRQAQCPCGWRGPDRFTEASARADQAHHKAEGVHRGIHAGPWLQQQQWGPITEIQHESGSLAFDPPNAIWPAGGQRIRVEDYDTDRPMLAVEAFDRTIQRFALTRASDPSQAPTTAP